MTGGSFGNRYLLEFVEGIEGSSLELSLWLEMTWDGQMESPKLVAFVHFSASLL